MTEHFSLLLSGDKSSDGIVELHAPFNNDLLATLDSASAAAVDDALSIAHDLYTHRDGWIPLDERLSILEKTAELMRERAETLAMEAAEEGGKPLIDSRVEVTRAIDGIQICIETMRTEAGDVIPMRVNPASKNRIAFTQKEPIGPVVAVSAFNHPLNLIVHQVAPAVAAGCPVIVKPAGDTPRSAMRFVAMLHEAGLPPQWAQALVAKESDVAEKLVTDVRVGFFSFIGSARIGWMLRSKLAPGARCALEHGGAAPVIVAADADLDAAIPSLAKAGFYHAGQVCVSVQRVFAHKTIARDVAQRLARAGSVMTIGDPTHENTDIGPLIRPQEIDRIDDWVQEAIADGAEKISGAQRVGETCYAATVLLDPPPDTTVSQKEIFGPVICVYSYDDLDAALAQANALPFAFQAAIWTSDLDTMLYANARLDASAVMINDHTAFRVDWMPFAGLKQSGHGVGGIGHTIGDMQIEKMTVIQSKSIL